MISERYAAFAPQIYRINIFSKRNLSGSYKVCITVQLQFKLFHPRIFEVFIKAHQTVDHSTRCDFNDSIGDGLQERVVMRSKQHDTFEIAHAFIESLYGFQGEMVWRFV